MKTLRRLTTLFLLLLASALLPAADSETDQVFSLVGEGQLKILQLKLFEPGELNQMRTQWGEGLLHRAVQRGQTEVVIWLLQNHCDVDMADSSANTPLHFAPGTRNLEIVKVLVQNGADIHHLDTSENTLLHEAAGTGTPEMVLYALSLSLDLNQQNRNLETPLMLAAANHNVDTTRELLAHAPLLDAQDDDGYTALHHAADPYSGWDADAKYEVAQMLLNAGADPDVGDHRDRLPCDRTRTWSLYFLLAAPTATFKVELIIALVSATVLALVPLIMWRMVSNKTA